MLTESSIWRVLTLIRSFYYGRFLVSFDGKYLNYESVRVSHAEFQNHGNEAEDLGSSEHEMFSIKVKHLDSEVFGPAFIEVCLF